MLTLFLAKRAAVFAVIVAVAGFCIGGFDVTVPVGVLLGTAVSVYKTRMFASFLTGLAHTSGVRVKSAVYQVFSHLLVFGLLIFAVIADTGLFFGLAAGLLTVPAAIMANAFTEHLGLTRNRWGDADAKGE